MFKFLFGNKGQPLQETQRQTAERALREINEIVAGMAEKPKVTLDLATGAFELVLPEQMPDEALALPAPEQSDSDSTSEAAEVDKAA